MAKKPLTISTPDGPRRISSKGWGLCSLMCMGHRVDPDAPYCYDHMPAEYRAKAVEYYKLLEACTKKPWGYPEGAYTTLNGHLSFTVGGDVFE